MGDTILSLLSLWPYALWLLSILLVSRWFGWQGDTLILRPLGKPKQHHHKPPTTT